MKYKSLLLLITFLFIRHISFADGYGDKIVNAPTVYFQLTGNSEIDNILQSSFEKYWKVNQFVAIPAGTSKKDIVISGGKAPVFLFINSYSINTPGYVDCIAVIWGNAGTFSKGKIDPDAELRRVNLFVPSDKMNFLDIDFAIPLAIKELNDDMMRYKKHLTWTDNPSILKDKTLLIPQEFVDKKHGLNPPVLSSANLASYKFKYKIMPTSQIKTIANDSSENSQYCYFTVDINLISIYDLATKDCIMNFTFKCIQVVKIKQSDVEKLSDEIASAIPPRKKK